MEAQIYAKIKKEVAYGFNIIVEDYVPVTDVQLAYLLRHMVASAYHDDDAGSDYFYDPNEGIICIDGRPGWWDNRNQIHLDMMALADKLDGNDFTFDYDVAVSASASA